MAESRNRVGGAYSLTVISPIVAGREEAVREYVEGLPVGADSPLARLDTLHFSRIQIFDRLVYQGPPQRPDSLQGCHLVFTSSFDGELGPYLEQLRTRLGAEADGWWGHCAGYPGAQDAVGFKRFIREHQVDSALFASACWHASVGDVRESLALRERIIDFAVAVQGLDAGALQRRFRETFGR